MRLDDRGLLLALHEGVFEQSMFDSFLVQLQAYARASYVALTIGKTGAGPLISRYLGDRKLERIRRMFLREHGIGPDSGRQMREGRVYGVQDFFDPASRFDWLRHNELQTVPELAGLRVVRVSGGGVEAWLACCGPGSKAAALSALLASLVPHLRVATRAFVTFDDERFRARIVSGTLDGLQVGWLTLDARCQVVDLGNVDHAFDRGLLRGGQGRRLVPTLPTTERAMTRLVKGFAEGSETRARIFNLNKDPPVDLLVAPLRVRSAMRGRPIAIAHIRAGWSPAADRSALLVEMFDLTPSEARLAWALVCGRSIAEAAGDLNITLETARGYSKRIYAKTGLRGQVDLVRRVLTSVLAIA
jgi:DNA-binding CsgD family transcriptional regulator